jgi:hypothetical protein
MAMGRTAPEVQVTAWDQAKQIRNRAANKGVILDRQSLDTWRRRSIKGA